MFNFVFPIFAHQNTDCKEPEKNDHHLDSKELNAEVDPFTLEEPKTETKSDIKLEFLLFSNPLRL